MRGEDEPDGQLHSAAHAEARPHDDRSRDRGRVRAGGTWHRHHLHLDPARGRATSGAEETARVASGASRADVAAHPVRARQVEAGRVLPPAARLVPSKADHSDPRPGAGLRPRPLLVHHEDADPDPPTPPGGGAHTAGAEQR